MFCIALSLSYFLLWLIYRKAFKSKKKVSKFLVFLGSIGLIIFYYTPPYSFYLEPSYWQFRNMCKLNELPNDEEKYNKILRYFDTDLDSLDWEELNREVEAMGEKAHFYSPNEVEYEFFIGEIRNSRYSIFASLYSNEKIFKKSNITLAIILGKWHTRRYYLDGNEGSGFYWSEEDLYCNKITKYNLETKK
ncbi:MULTISPECIES: hypothetical protein [Helicobacter]